MPPSSDRSAGTRVARVAEQRIEAFADDLGRLLGTARAKAEHGLGQRAAIAKTLVQVRDTANALLGQLTSESSRRQRGLSRRRSAATATEQPVRRRRKLSPAARKAISDAQKRRWAAARASKASRER